MAVRLAVAASIALSAARGQDVALMAANEAGAALVRLSVSRTSSGALSAATLTVDAEAKFSAFSVREGESGAPLITRMGVLDLSDPLAQVAVEKLISNPSGLSLWIDDRSYGALNTAQESRFEAELLPENQSPPNFLLKAAAPVGVSVYTLPGGESGARATALAFEMTARFLGPVGVTGLHLHAGAAGVVGRAIAASTLSPARVLVSVTGLLGYRETLVSSKPETAAALAAVLGSPGNHYLDLHTAAIPLGAMRGQLMPASSAPPSLLTVLASGSDISLTTLAQGGLMSVYGRNLAQGAGGAGNPDGSAAWSLNGASLTIGNFNAPMLWAAPDVILAQVPFEVSPGTYPVRITTASGESRTFDVRVAAVAPALFQDAAGGLCLKNSDYSRVTAQNPATPGEIVFCYATGLGQTSPPLRTAAPAPADPLANVSGVSVSVGPATVNPVYAIATPGSVGTYQIAFAVPQVTGAAQVSIAVRGASSNRVQLHVR